MSEGFRGDNCFSRIGTGDNTLGSPLFRGAGGVGVREPENAEVGSGGESNRGSPIYNHDSNEYGLQFQMRKTSLNLESPVTMNMVFKKELLHL